jgi:hypothetical protein
MNGSADQTVFFIFKGFYLRIRLTRRSMDTSLIILKLSRKKVQQLHVKMHYVTSMPSHQGPCDSLYRNSYNNALSQVSLQLAIIYSEEFQNSSQHFNHFAKYCLRVYLKTGVTLYLNVELLYAMFLFKNDFVILEKESKMSKCLSLSENRRGHLKFLD